MSEQIMDQSIVTDNATGNSRPAIVVSAFNRPASLARLLASLLQAGCPDGTHLVISIDGGGAPEVEQCARNFEWPFGDKEIVRHDQNLGLKRHILSCGDLSRRFGSIILIEDDLYVSCGYYKLAQALLHRYATDSLIAGVSLYANEVNHIARLPFKPLPDGNDVYFQQYGASWGQAWTALQWECFRTWFDERDGLADDELDFSGLPEYIRGWNSKKSWLKFFNAYLVESGRSIVYPRVSYCTNYGDAGENCTFRGTQLQTALATCISLPLRLPDFVDAMARYDVYFEFDAAVLARHCPLIAGASLEVNLYLKKSLSLTTADYMLAPIQHKESEMNFGLNLKPIEQNILLGNPGNGISLVKIDQLTSDMIRRPPVNLLRYYSGPMGVKATMRSNIRHAVDVWNSRRSSSKQKKF